MPATKSKPGRKPSLVLRYLNQELAMCNCAGCSSLMLGSKHKDAVRAAKLAGEDIACLPPLVAGRMDGRPYCATCLDVRQPPSLAKNLTPRMAAKLT